MVKKKAQRGSGRRIDAKTGKGTQGSGPYVRELCEYKIRSRITWRKLARGIGVAESNLLAYRDGHYRGNVDNVAAKIRDYLHRAMQRNQALVIPYVETTIARAVQEVLALAQLEGTIGVVYGPAGIGKTLAIEDYCQRHGYAYFVTASPAVRTPSAIAREMLYATAESRGSDTTSRNVRRLTERLYGTESVVVVDEAQHLRLDALELARAVHDATGCGLVFCGTAVLYDNLTRHRDELLEQLFSRVGFRRCVSDEVPPEDVVAVVDAALGKAATKQIKKYLLERAELGGLRIVTRQLKNAARMADLAGESLSLEHVREAEKTLMV
ncbi:MAG: AAA family ATPase [bacterium]